MFSEFTFVLTAPHATPEARDFDLGVYCVGYEARSTHAAKKLKARTRRALALKYGGSDILSFSSNLDWVSTQPNTTTLQIDEFSAELIEQTVQEIVDENGGGSVFVDVSSMDRATMGKVLLGVMRGLPGSGKLSILYVPGKFAKPSFAFPPVLKSGPAIPELKGRVQRPATKLELILGLGYEYGVALGMVEHFEPSHAFAFAPVGKDRRYYSAVMKANFGFDFGVSPVQLAHYNVSNPLALFLNLLSIVDGVSSDSKVVMVPMGPKIFSAITILVGLIHFPNVCVWRVSLSGPEAPRQVLPEEDIIEFSIQKVIAAVDRDLGQAEHIPVGR